MKCVHVALFLFGIFLPSISSRHVHFYRKDYTYIEEFDAFYKIHWDVTEGAWNKAFLTCGDEEASLFYPKDNGEWALVKMLTSKMSNLRNVTDIFVGFNDEFEMGELIDVDGHSNPYPLNFDTSSDIPHGDSCISMNIENGLFKVYSCDRTPDMPLPYMCKKVVKVESCPTVDQGYIHAKELKKCYKLHKNPKVWQEAMKNCIMEGGILVTMENSAQVEVLRNMIERDGATKYFVGVRKMFSSSDYYSVKGQKLSELYYRSYDEQQQQYNCGAILWNNNYGMYTTTAECTNKLPFICEMDVTV